MSEVALRIGKHTANVVCPKALRSGKGHGNRGACDTLARLHAFNHACGGAQPPVQCKQRSV